ncbi:MAG: hypothetical protein AB7D29_06295 [Campylobacterales bacterium]
MQKLTLLINGSAFEITLADNYAEAFKEEISKDLNLNEDNSVKTLLYAFMQKNYEILELKREIEKISDKLDDKLGRLF